MFNYELSYRLTDENQLLIKKPYKNMLLTIYLDNGKVKGRIKKDNHESAATLIKGFPEFIFNYDPIYLHQLKAGLSSSCYLTSSFDEITLVGKLPGGGVGQVIGATVGVGQVIGGIALTVFTGGWGAWFGSGLISAGVQSTVYSIITPEDKMNAGEYSKQAFIGGATGLVSGGIGGLAAKSSFAVKTSAQAVAGVASKVSSVTIDAALHSKDIAKELNEKVGAAGLVAGAVTGAFSGVMSGESSKLTHKLINQVESKVVSVVAGSVCGGAAGAVSGATTTLVTNCIEGKKDITENVALSTIIGGVMGAAMGSVSGAQQHSRKIAKNAFVIAGDGKQYVIVNSSDRPLAPTADDIKYAEEHGSVDLATGIEPTEQVLGAVFANEGALIDPSGAINIKGAFFSSSENRQLLLERLNLSPDQVETLLFILSEIETGTDGLFEGTSHIINQFNLISPLPGEQVGAHPMVAIAFRLYARCQHLCLSKLPEHQTAQIGEVKKLIGAFRQAYERDTSSGIITFDGDEKHHYGCDIESSITGQAKRMSEVIKSLPHGESYLFLGGYKKHAYYLKFFYQNGKARVHIYNGGGGAKRHVSTPSGMIYPYTKVIDEKDLEMYLRDLLAYAKTHQSIALNMCYSHNTEVSPASMDNVEAALLEAFPKQNAGNCTYHNLNSSLAPELGGAGSVLYEMGRAREINVCERLMFERNDLDYQAYLAQQIAGGNLVLVETLPKIDLPTACSQDIMNQAATVFATAAITVPLVPVIKERDGLAVV